MPGTPGYAFDNTSEHAGGRFDALATCCGPMTFARPAGRLLGVGLTPDQPAGRPRLLDDPAFAVSSSPLVTTRGTRP
ncbi:hypothetical protein ACFVYF_22720 [Streptomyces sp. NPDC058274]|uniref:hypothetical protein n=1 Tax=Streptomyces sp. NPDC058274 TaxID=3346416 RepID=UPI0036F00968